MIIVLAATLLHAALMITWAALAIRHDRVGFVLITLLETGTIYIGARALYRWGYDEGRRA